MSSESMRSVSQEAHPLGALPFVPREEPTLLARAWLHHLREGDRRSLIAAGDALITGLAGAGAAILMGHALPQIPLFAACWLLTCLAALYATDTYSLKPPREIELAKTVTASGVAVMLVAWLSRAAWRDLVCWGLAIVASAAGVIALRRLWAAWLAAPWAHHRLLLMCSPAEATDALRELERHPLAGIKAIGIVHHGPHEAADFPLAILGGPHHLPSLIESCQADRVVTGSEAIAAAPWHSSVGDHAKATDLTSLYEALSGRVPVRFLDDRWILESFAWHRGWGNWLAKRALDLTVASLGLLLSAPLFPILALAIYLEDRGPIFYSQFRVGLNGRSFRILKLRTMRVDAESQGACWAQLNDRRATRFGKMLRRSRLDELPQLINVLRGEMSMVGPRPERSEFVSELEQAIPHYQLRHLVLPGLTGWAQVRFPYGSSLEDAEEKLKYDLYYLKHRSLGFDLRIMLRTVAVVLNKMGSR